VVLGRPWAEYRRGKPITQNQLARALKPLGIAPQVIRDGDRTARGYLLAQFTEAFARYLGEECSSNRNTVTNAMNAGTSDTFQTVTPESDVTVQKDEKSNNDGLCYGVTVEKGENGRLATSDVIYPLVCEHCGAPEKPDSPVLTCAIDGEEHLLHPSCRAAWLELEIPDCLRRAP
jgi:Protein of unknown function (DUF3631)